MFDLASVKIRGPGGPEKAGENDEGPGWWEKTTCQLGVLYQNRLM